MAIYGEYTEEFLEVRSDLMTWVLMNLRYIPLSPEEIVSIESELCEDITPERLEELVKMVNDNLPDRIECGMNYNQGDIQRKLNKIMQDERK